MINARVALEGRHDDYMGYLARLSLAWLEVRASNAETALVHDEALSKSPPVRSDGRMQGGSLLPSNAASYHQMILTRETSERPTRPGPIVLRGSFALH